MNKNEMIDKFSMEKHVEGGYFVETYRAEEKMKTEERVDGERDVLTSIYYMLTDDRPIGNFHKNTSNIVHYFHAGSALTYYIIHPNGELEKAKLGLDIANGETPQLLVKGGCWKATVLEEGEFGLLGEAVAPGFDYRDMEIAKADLLKKEFPHLSEEIEKYSKK